MVVVSLTSQAHNPLCYLHSSSNNLNFSEDSTTGGLGVACRGLPDFLKVTERWIVTHSWSTVLRIPSEALLNLEPVEVSGGGPRSGMR